MKKITYLPEAVKYLKRMPKNDSKRVVSKIEQYAKSPESLANNVTKLAGEPFSRLRVGNYRVIFDETDRVIEIQRIAPRGRAYK